MYVHSIKHLCRELRKNETPYEKQLWGLLKGRQFASYKFRRQHPFIYQSIQGRKSFFIADFYCPAASLIIELDGKIHEFQKGYDETRDFVLSQLGLTTIRIKNEALENDCTEVMNKILLYLKPTA
jgi:very-short-patch-repair endonuclease